MSFVFGIMEKERNEIISTRYHLVDILNIWNDMSCDYSQHQLILIDAEKQRDAVLCSWTRRLNISKSSITALLFELESLALNPISGFQVSKII